MTEACSLVVTQVSISLQKADHRHHEAVTINNPDTINLISTLLKVCVRRRALLLRGVLPACFHHKTWRNLFFTFPDDFLALTCQFEFDPEVVFTHVYSLLLCL